MRYFMRLAFIVLTLLRHGVDELVLSRFDQHRWLRALSWVITRGRRLDAPRGPRRARVERILDREVGGQPQPSAAALTFASSSGEPSFCPAAASSLTEI